MFTGTIDTVQMVSHEAGTANPCCACHFLQGLHNHLVVVYCNDLLLHRSVPAHAVPELLRYAVFLQETPKFPEFFVDIFHVRSDTLTDGSEVMVIQFLSLRRHCSEQGTSGIDQVFSLQIFLLVNQEILLLRSNGRCYLFGGCISKQSQKYAVPAR